MKESLSSGRFSVNYTTYELRVLKTTVGIHITLSCGNGIKHTLCRYFVLEQLPVAIVMDQCVPVLYR